MGVEDAIFSGTPTGNQVPIKSVPKTGREQTLERLVSAVSIIRGVRRGRFFPAGRDAPQRSERVFARQGKINKPLWSAE
ncbi:unnamed protein product, partial [Iphiclides podalirius]